MRSNFKITITCFIIALNVELFEANPIEITGKGFVSTHTQDASGNYHFRYEDKDELANRTETGEVEKSKSGKTTLVVKGSYYNTFESDCQTIIVKYMSDENGFRAQFIYKEMTDEQRKADGGTITVVRCPVYREMIRTDCIRTLCGG